ncbi:hypothetical protein [Isoptericola sp. NPDC056605]|uniref:hypothetical protein n=1 Tax=Isoptericola sp. NPDC056605 TaxID=3345876 RepID=UPI00368FE907
MAILRGLPTFTAGVGYSALSMLVVAGHPESYVLAMAIPVATVLVARLAAYLAGQRTGVTPSTSGYAVVTLACLLLGVVSLVVHFPGPAVILGFAFMLLGIAHHDSRACAIAFGAMIASVPLDIMGFSVRNASEEVEVWKGFALGVVGVMVILVSLYFFVRDRRLPPRRRDRLGGLI